MESKNEIKLVQKPVITHALVEVGKSITDRLDALNLKNLVATEDTIQTLKKLRAELNKEHAEFKGQMKAVSDVYMEDLNEVKTVFKTEVSEKYENGESILKTTIGDFENKLKIEKKQKIVTFFNELIASEKIDFITFENVGIEVNLSASDKSLKDKCKEYVQKVIDDISLIKTNQFEAEIMVEYKSTLNVARSIQTVQNRKELERQEAERIKITETNRRKQIIARMDMIFIDMVKYYEYKTCSDIFITLHDLEEFSKEEFANKVIQLEEAIKEKTFVPVANQTTSPADQPAPVVYGVSYVASAPLEAPKVEEKPKLLIASFKCTGTMEQLKSVGAFMKANGIIYENI